MYISEIAHPSIRASLCSAAKVFSQLGLLAAYVMGAWLDWRQLAIVCAAAPLMLLITGQVIKAGKYPITIFLNGPTPASFVYFRQFLQQINE